MTEPEPVDIGALLKQAGQEERAAKRASATNGSAESRPSVAQTPRAPGVLDPYAAAAVGAELSRLDQLARPWHEGAGWDTTTFEVACNLIEIANSGWGYTIEHAWADLHRHAPTDHAWGAEKVTEKWNSARGRVGGTGRLRTALPGFDVDVVEVTAAELGIDVDQPDATLADLEARFWSSRDVLGHLQTFARSRRVSPWGVLGVALARVVTATGPAVTLPPIVGGKGSLNLFIGLVGASGDGKGACEAVAGDALHVGAIRQARIASGEAIAHVYKHRAKGGAEPDWKDDDHAAMIQVAEIDRLAGQAGRQGSTIMADLRSAWSGEQLGQVAADATRSIPLEAHSYRLTLVAGIQPMRAGCLLDDADGGTPQRFLWFPVSDADAPDVPPAEPKPWQWVGPDVPALVRAGGFAGAQVEVCEPAREAIVGARLARLRGDGHALDGHALLARLKTAAALGLLEGRAEVTADDWELAGIVAAKSASTRARVINQLLLAKQAEAESRAIGQAKTAVTIERHLTNEAMQRVCRSIIRRLERAGADKWVAASVIRRGTNAPDRGLVPEALDRLQETGQIHSDTAGPDGSGAKYQLVERK